MNDTMNQTRTCAEETGKRWSRRGSAAVAVIAIVAAAVGLQLITPEPAPGTAPMVIAIARADCPPDCGGGPGNGGTPSGPPGGGTEFAPPSMPAMPSYEPGRGQLPLDQNNSVSIYNSAAPQPSQAAQPSQAPTQNQDGTYNRAANGEQQPIQYSRAPGNQQLNSDWQKLSDRLNNPQEQEDQGSVKNSTNNSNTNQDDNSSNKCKLFMDSFATGQRTISQAEDFYGVTLENCVSGGYSGTGIRKLSPQDPGKLPEFDCSKHPNSNLCLPPRVQPTPPPQLPPSGDKSNGLETVYDLRTQAELKQYIKTLKDAKQIGAICGLLHDACNPGVVVSDQIINKLEEVRDEGKCAELHIYLGYLGGYTTVTKPCI